MSERDPAFLWETEALRGGPPRPAPAPSPAAPDRFVTLQDAHDATGIPIGTLRKWARRGHIPNRLDETAHGDRRMVDLDAVLSRAAELGRDLDPPGGPSPAPAPPPHQAAEPGPEPPAPAGTMIVPIDAWEKMLLQLGNLHEAGQQLAEARERAAKAETEAQFLRERLAELRAEREATTTASEPEPPSATATWAVSVPGSPERGPLPPVLETWWQFASRRWRNRRR